MKTFALLVLVWIFGVDIEKRMARYLLVDLEAGQTIDKGSAHGYDENDPDCSCDYVFGHAWGACKINEPSPPGYKCWCYISFLMTCNGNAYKCKSEEEHGCNGCKEKECCLGDCTGG